MEPVASMAGKNESKRVQETKGRIRDAFLQLYLKKRIEKITIKEISDLAQVNRGTFYAHYQDIYDLKEKVEEEAIQELKVHALPVMQALITRKTIEEVVLPWKFFYENQRLLELFFGERAEVSTVRRLKTIMQETVVNTFGLDKGISPGNRLKLEYALEYVASAQVGIISHWFRKGLKPSMAELSQMMIQFNLAGPITYVTEELKKIQGAEGGI
ncbi:TetR/AcrR family transcriptional regulator [Aminipila butyrica]|uniref:TetR/AcrR family transcriptional regulator n=1 Tax=Aminipila butyrica TaxID=433296 RepID=A0A858BYK3_9FIRM|nr:TetR/AcrR family transcriptional regulator [Aminipila butyrica]QIB70198.1 TetR/AcrR family transcriptional regulator [Aminipila butyrica]